MALWVECTYSQKVSTPPTPHTTHTSPAEDIVRQRRIKFRGNKKVKFTEGWVEFLDKRVAKVVATTLNCTPVGRKKRSIYHDDLWNIKYLPKFRWTHLTEKIGTTIIV